MLRYSEEFKTAEMSGDHETGKGVGAIAVQQPRCPTTKHSHRTGPAVGSIKLNSDTSYMEETSESSTGVVEAEAKAALIGLNALSRVYMGPVFLELGLPNSAEGTDDWNQSRSPAMDF